MTYCTFSAHPSRPSKVGRRPNDGSDRDAEEGSDLDATDGSGRNGEFRGDTCGYIVRFAMYPPEEKMYGDPWAGPIRMVNFAGVLGIYCIMSLYPHGVNLPNLPKRDL